MVTLVASNCGYERFTLAWKTNCIRQPKRQLPGCPLFLIQVGDSLTDVLKLVSACVVVGKMNWEAASQVA